MLSSFGSKTQGQGEIELKVKLHHSHALSKSFDLTYPIFHRVMLQGFLFLFSKQIRVFKPLCVFD